MYPKLTSGSSHEDQATRLCQVEWWNQGRQGCNLHRKRSPERVSLWLRQPLRRQAGNESRGVARRRARRLLHDGPFADSRRSQADRYADGYDGGSCARAGRGWVRDYQCASHAARPDSGRRSGEVCGAGGQGEGWVSGLEAVQDGDHVGCGASQLTASATPDLPRSPLASGPPRPQPHAPDATRTNRAASLSFLTAPAANTSPFMTMYTPGGAV